MKLGRLFSFANFFAIHAFFISNTFITNTRLKLAKNQAKAKEHLEAELLLLGNYSVFLSTLSSKNNRTYKKSAKKVCLF